MLQKIRNVENELLKVANDEDSMESYLHGEQGGKLNKKHFTDINEWELLQEYIKIHNFYVYSKEEGMRNGLDIPEN